jgi:hypothetical protein
MGLILTAGQAVALEKTEKGAHGEFEGECRGYCYVGTMKGVGRIYQQIFVIPIRR